MSPADKHLLSLDPAAPRNRLQDIIRQRGDALARKAHRFLTLATEYNERERFRRAAEEPEPPYHVLLRRLTGHLFTRQLPHNPKLPSSSTTSTPEYVLEYERLNGLVSVTATKTVAPRRRRAA